MIESAITIPANDLPAVPFPHRHHNAGRAFFCALSLLSLQALTTEAFAVPVPLRVEWTNNAPVLVVGPITIQGALFVYAAPELSLLASSSALLLQTNTPQSAAVRLPISAAGDFAARGFFRAAHWTGQAPRLLDIPAGTFVMGTPPSEAERSAWEGPQTTVTVTYSFKMGKYEVTQAEYQSLMSNNPSYFPGVASRPVEQVSWTNAMNYCARLTDLQRQAGCLPAGWAYRLPTEAEWEYACRAGTTSAFAFGQAIRSGMANFDGHEEYDAVTGTVFNPVGVKVDKPTAVGNYAPNNWGLFDMHGNVWEWCLDWWGLSLPGGSVTNSPGPTSGSERVVRGGCWYNYGRLCRSGSRFPGQPGYRGSDIGFRVVLAPATP